MSRKIKRACLLSSLAFFLTIVHSSAQHSIAREWNELLLESIRNDFARPTIHARNLYHCSVLMYDVWAAYDQISVPFFLGRTTGNYFCPFNGIAPPGSGTVDMAREEAISYGMYRLLRQRFTNSPASVVMLSQYDAYMATLGYDTSITTTDYSTGSAAALGNYIADQLINFGLQDGSNESFGYTNLFYSPVNPSMVIELSGNPNITNLNRWQPLSFDFFIDQSGNIFGANTPDFLSPEWGHVTPFCLSDSDKTLYTRNGNSYPVFHDPGAPPEINAVSGGGASNEYKWGFQLVSTWSSHMDSADPTMVDISPASIGNITNYPTTFAGLQQFYDLINGGDSSPGHATNPYTGQAYQTQMIKRGDYARVLAEFWADGPDSETPPGHWFTILNYVSDNPIFIKKFQGAGAVLTDLEWDVKSYFTLAGAMHDAAIAAWSVKGWYDYVRPVSAIRALADYGQSSDPLLPSYHPAGIELIPNLIELVSVGDPLAGSGNSNVGKIKVFAWKGPTYINDPTTDEAGVDWILAEDWLPYQRATFVTPPFAGYVSGHSTFSRAAAEVMTELTGDAFFPGGMGEFVAPQNQFLVFEQGPSQTVTLQWATYRDASDQCSLSRIWGGIHPPVDDIPGRLMGIDIGQDAFSCARNFILGEVCPSSLVINTISSSPGSQQFQAGINIQSDAVVNSPLNVTYEAGIDIDLFSSFEVIQGATFLADIRPCL